MHKYIFIIERYIYRICIKSKTLQTLYLPKSTIYYCYFYLLSWIYFTKKNTLVIFLSIVFVSSSFLSGYHVGIEHNIFAEYSGCSSTNIDLIDKTEIIKSLNDILPSCKEINFRLFGLSLATINLFISILISLYTVKLLLNEKNRSN